MRTKAALWYSFIIGTMTITTGITYGQTPQFAPQAILTTLNIPTNTSNTINNHTQIGFAIEDIDGDGDLDILRMVPGTLPTFNRGLRVDVYENTAGSNATPIYPNLPMNYVPNTFNVMSGALTDIHHAQLTFADIDNDGDKDVFTFGCYDECTNGVSPNREVSYMRNDGTGYTMGGDTIPFGLERPFNLSSSGPTSAAIQNWFLDYDGDGDLDYGYFGGLLTFQENIGTPTSPNFGTTSNISIPAGGYFIVPVLGDYDGDNDYDLLGLDPYYGSVYYENIGDTMNMSFTTPQSNPFGLTTGGAELYIVYFEDIDGDGDKDLIGSTGQASDGHIIYWYENIGNQSVALSAAANSTSDVTCNGGADGEAMVIGAGGSGTYTYAWSDGQTTATATGLAAGNYTVTVNDGTDTEIASVTIVEPTIIEAIGTVTNDNTGASGMIDLSVSGGVAPYSYVWNNGDITEDISGLGESNYTVTVTDANGCTVVESFMIVYVNINEVGYQGQYLDVYPNPAQDILTINADIHEATIRIYNMMGVTVLEHNVVLEQGVINLNVSNLPAGQYILELQNMTTFLRQQWVKK